MRRVFNTAGAVICGFMLVVGYGTSLGDATDGSSGGATGAPPALERPQGVVHVLGINDTYRIEGVAGYGGFARLRTLRSELEREDPDLLVIHAGDMLFPSLLSRELDGRQMIDVLNWLDGDGPAFDQRLLATFGNHEFDKGRMDQAAELDARIDESRFRWVSSNVDFVTGPDGEPIVGGPNLVPRVLMPLNGVQVGVFGLTNRLNVPEYVASIREPVATAREETAVLRRAGAELVIAITHQDWREDIALLEELGEAGPDLVVGGHDHVHMAKQASNGRWVVKGDADSVRASIAELSLRQGGTPVVSVGHRELGPEEPALDPLVAARVRDWIRTHEEAYCANTLAGGGEALCLEEKLGRTAVALEADEMRIRRFETNLGDWIADRLRNVFGSETPDVAFLNSGALRLGYDLPAGAAITRRTVEELLPYPMHTRLIRIDGATLQRVLERSVSEWRGHGHWLQVSGLAFCHDPERRAVTGLSLIKPQGLRPVRPDEPILAVTIGYLVDPSSGQDGYTMLSPAQVIAEGPALKPVVEEALRAAGQEGIAPVREGRICNRFESGPCLLSEEVCGFPGN